MRTVPVVSKNAATATATPADGLARPLTPFEAGAPDDAGVAPTEIAGPGGEGPSFYALALTALAGRWLLVLGLGLILGAAGTAVGWVVGTPTYLSEGLVRITYSVPTVMGNRDDESIPVEIYHALLQSQQALIASRAQIEAALREPAWAATGRGASPEAVERFADDLKVELKSGADFLRISYSDPDPNVAAAAVRSVVGAFARSYQGQEEQFERKRLDALTVRQRELTARLDDLRKRATAAAGGAAAEDTGHMHEATVREVMRLEAALSDIRLAAIMARAGGGGTPEPQQIATTDPVMRGYLTDRDRLRDEMTQMRLAGYREEHPAIQRRAAALDVVNARIAEYAKEYRGAPTDAGGDSRAANPPPTPGTPDGIQARRGRSAESLRAEEASIAALCENARKQMLALGLRRSEAQRLTADADAAARELGEVTQRIEKVQLERSAGGRLSVVSAGETPTKPFRNRRVPMMAMGALLGACLPAGLVILRELVGTRYGRFGQAETDWRDHARLLGVLPALSESPRGAAAAARVVDAAHCVHQIRMALQIAKPTGRGATYLISSATAGEGKTNVTAALGIAFAGSGSRTLIADCDLVSRQLTCGFAMEQDEGLYEALTAGTLGGRVRETRQPNLWILPAGRTGPQGATTVSPRSIQTLLAEAGGVFDVVLVDAGPILGSLEASAVAARVDGVILVIARAQARALVERAIRQLNDIHARLAGMIFNRAESGDFRRSWHSYATSSQPADVPAQPAQKPGAAAATTATVRRAAFSSGLGPLVGSVATFTAAAAAGDGDRLQA